MASKDIERNEAAVAAAIGLLVGTGGGYAINEVMSIGRTVELKEEIARLKEEAEQRLTVDVPNSQEASAAIAKSGRTIRISECKPRQAVPGVACTGIIVCGNNATGRPVVCENRRDMGCKSSRPHKGDGQ